MYKGLAMSKSKEILFIVTSHHSLDGKNNATGTWLEEMATPYYSLSDLGHNVHISSPHGGNAPLDPGSLQDPWLTDMGKRFLNDAIAHEKIQNSVPLSQAIDKDFDVIYMVGGAGTVWDFPKNQKISEILGRIQSNGGVVAAICHGVSGLLNVVDEKVFAQGKRITSISDAEDEMIGLDKVVPFMPENALREAGATVNVGEPFEAHVVVDGRLVTGQNPASATSVAEEIIKLLL